METLVNAYSDMDTSQKVLHAVGGVFVAVVSVVAIRKLFHNSSPTMPAEGWKEYLSSIYFNPKQPASFSGSSKRYYIVKKEGKFDIGLHHIKKWLASQDACTLTTSKFVYREAKKDYPRDTVIHHQIGRGPYAPSMTPFAVKLETYLRMARIPYQNVHGMQMSSKSKLTWIEYNGQAVADSTLCIEFLNKKLGVDLNRNLSPADRGVAQALQVMAEEHMYWFLVLFRWVYDNDKSLLMKTLKLGTFLLWLIRRNIKKQTWNQGLGRHTEGEVTEMFKKDLQSLSDFIGTKKFLMGDEPCETDCAVFGMLSQVYWHFTGTGHENIIKDKYPNLAVYCERMKEMFWPDWDQCITHCGTREATK